MKGERETRPCDYCGVPVTKLLSQARGKKWYCNHFCNSMARYGYVTEQKKPDAGKKETRPCAICGTEVTRYRTTANNAKEWLCSVECLGKMNAKRTQERIEAGIWHHPRRKRHGEERPCGFCKKPVYQQPHDASDGSGCFCSKECHDNYMRAGRTLRACEFCGEPMAVRPGEATRRRYCSRGCYTAAKTGDLLDRTHNDHHVRKDAKGYVLVWEPEHQKSNHGWIYEHRLVMEQQIGRLLESEEVVHHKDGNKSNNDPENLELLCKSSHNKITMRELWDAVEADRAQLEEYRKRFGPLDSDPTREST